MFGIIDPITWAGNTSDLGSSVRDLIFPRDGDTLAPRYRASLMELVLGSATIDLGLACELVCVWAAADFFHNISACNLDESA